MLETTLYFVRHGETEYNRRRIMQGRRIDSSLNKTGWRQAAALARRFQDVPIDAIYTSALRRTIETASPVAELHQHATVRHVTDLDEMCWGVHEGEPWSDRLEAVLDDVYARWDRREFDFQVDQGESILQVQRRAVRAVERIVRDHSGEAILVVTHGRLLRVLLSTILGLGLERMHDIDHANTGVNVVIHVNGAFESTLLNCTAHLDAVDSVLIE